MNNSEVFAPAFVTSTHCAFYVYIVGEQKDMRLHWPCALTIVNRVLGLPASMAEMVGILMLCRSGVGWVISLSVRAVGQSS